MADFFGGILDPLKSTGDDLGALVGSMGGGGGKELSMAGQEQNFYSSSYRGYQDPFHYEPPREKDQRQPAADFNTIEQQWLRRLQRFNDVKTVV